MERKIFNINNVIENLNVCACNCDVVIKSDTINYVLIRSANEVDVVEGLDSISVNAKSSGNISINNGSINIENMNNSNFIVGNGNIIYSNINMNNNIIIGDGNVVGGSCLQNDIEITVPKTCKIKNLNIKGNVSDLIIDDLNLSTLEAKVSTGNIKVLSSKFNEGTLKSNTGNINVLNNEFNKGNLETNTGNITVELLKDYKQWIIEAKTNIGLVRLPQKFSSYDSNKKLKIKVNCGNIVVK